MREDPKGAVFQREVDAYVIITGRLLQGDRGFQGLVVTAAAVQLVFAGRLPGPRVLPPRSPDAGRRHADNTVPRCLRRRLRLRGIF